LSDDAAAPLLCGGVIGYRALKMSAIAPGGRLPNPSKAANLALQRLKQGEVDGAAVLVNEGA
jgi:hypothetical protein